MLEDCAWYGVGEEEGCEGEAAGAGADDGDAGEGHFW